MERIQIKENIEPHDEEVLSAEDDQATDDYEEVEEVPPPFLPQKRIIDHKYTLVLDLDETLIHYITDQDTEILELLDGDEDDVSYMIRPFCNQFLTELSNYFELVIFTAAMKDYADWIVDGIDKRGSIKHRLYRQHCRRTHVSRSEEEGGDYYMAVKDMRLLGRDIKKTIIIDNLKENFWSTCPNNGLEIKSWYGVDMCDQELKNFIPFLK